MTFASIDQDFVFRALITQGVNCGYVQISVNSFKLRVSIKEPGPLFPVG